MKTIKDNIYLMRCGGKPGTIYLLLNLFMSFIGSIKGIYTSVILPTVLIYGIAGKIEYYQLLIYIGILFGFIALDATVFNYIGTIYMTKLNIEIDKRISLLIAEKTRVLDIQKFDDAKFYDECQLTSRQLNSKIYSSYSLTCQIFASVVSIILNVTTIFVLSYKSLAIFAVAVLLMGIPSLIATKTRIRWFKANVRNDRRFDFVANTYNTINLAKELKDEKFNQIILDEYDNVYKDTYKLAKKYIGTLISMNIIQDTGSKMILNIGLLFYLSYQSLVLHIMEWTNILAVYQSIQNLIGIITGMNSILINYGENSAYVDNFKTLLEYEPIMKSGTQSVEHHEINSIELSDVTFRYPKTATNILNHVNVSIGKNEKVALVGRNGTGKTTMLKLLLRFYDPDEGKILVNGIDIKDYDADQYRHEFGVLFQDVGLLEASVRENVLFTSDNQEGNEELNDALEQVSLKRKISNLQHEADTTIGVEIDQEGTLLSGGEQQRLLLARVIANKKSVVFLDEPTSHMDTQTEAAFYQDVFRILDNQIVLFITHRLISTVNADKIIVFDKDKVVECGNHQELMELKGHYYKMFRMQQKMYKMGDSHD